MSFNLAAHIRDGYRFESNGSGVSVTHPDGRSGFGSDEEQAVLNIGAQILPSPPPGHPLHGEYHGRLLIRADQSEVQLDAALAGARDASA